MTGRLAAALVLVSLAAEACSGPAGVGSDVPAVGLTVYGAASLGGVLEEVKTAYAAAVPGLSLAISTGSSAALATQIEQGARADVFLSADTKSPQALVDKGLADGTLVVFARNELTIIVPSANPAGITSPFDLGRAGLRVIAAGEEVPITRYATRLVANLAGLPGAPAGFAAAYAANIASREDSVKGVVAKVELGEGDAGIVYATDAKASTKVATVDVPEGANVPATYAGIVVGDSSNPAAARAFLAWLDGPDGRAVLASFGFLPPP